MASRMVQLNALKQGIVRLRTKGGADPSTLYDLVNGYVTIDGSIRSRPGTVKKVDLPPGTKGMCVFHGKIIVFATEPKAISNPLCVAVVISHPTNPSLALKEIHFAAPFMGFLYVAAEFANGDVFHYWLRSSGPWQAEHIYREGEIVEPTTPNGLAYEAHADNLPPNWKTETAYKVGDVIRPSTSNGYKYTVKEVAGDNPASGKSEPDWPASDGAEVTEYVGLEAPKNDSTPSGGDRYSGLPGWKKRQYGMDEPPLTRNGPLTPSGDI